jgi:hypothetical protein
MEVIIYIVLVIGIIYLYILAIEWFFNHAALTVLTIGSIAYIVMILVNYFRAFGDCFTKKLPASINETIVPPEPAFKNYFFRKAFLDYSDIVKKAWEYDLENSTDLFNWNVAIVKNGAWFLTWPIALTLFGVFFVGAIAAVIAFSIFGIVHLLIVSTICIIVYIIALYLRSIEWISMIWRRITYVCPHSGCYKPIALPEYICPQCGETHKKLIPGSYGLFARRCKCNKAKLPTLTFLGRRKLEAQCPHCKRPLSKDIGAASNIHIPIIGGPSAGKTNYLMASVIEIERDSSIQGRKMEFPEPRDKKIFELNKTLFNQGNPVSKTVELSPESFLLRIKEPSGKDNLIYIYDAAGELYGDSSDTRRQHKYFCYSDGLLFLVDPFSIRQVIIDYNNKIAEFTGDLKPSNEAPQDVYDRMIATLMGFSSGKHAVRKIPIMVVLTKVDAFDLLEKIGVNSTAIKDGDTGKASAAVRNWFIKNGEGNLIRSIEKDFSTVQYSYCSSLGHMPAVGKAFTPSGVLSPVNWLLKHRAVKIVGQTEKGISLKSEKIAYAFAVLFSTLVFSICGYGLTVAGQELIPEYTGDVFINTISDCVNTVGRLVGISSKPPESFNSATNYSQQVDNSVDIINQTGYMVSPAIIRNGPSKYYSSLTSLKRGRSVYVIGKDRNSNWYKIQFDKNNSTWTGYVAGKLLTFQSPQIVEANSTVTDVVNTSNIAEEKVLNYPDGRKYSGTTINGKPSGQGKEYFLDHTYLEGTWQNGKRNGTFIYHKPDGTTEDQEFQNGRRTK